MEALFRNHPENNVLHISREWAGYSHNKVKCYCRNCSDVRYFIQKCGNRDCPVCRRREFVRLLRKYRGPLWRHLKSRGIKTNSLKLLTLTIRNIPVERSHDKDVVNLRAGVRSIIRSFAKMRRWKRYRRMLTGGLRVVEIVHVAWKKNKNDEWIKTDEWNIHMHVLCQGAFQQVCCQMMKDANAPGEIQNVEDNFCNRCRMPCWRRDWKKASGCPVLDIRKAHNPKAGLVYILKYFTKAPRVDGMYRIYNAAMKGVVLVSPFGEWRGIEFGKIDVPCETCGKSEWMSTFELFRLLQMSVSNVPLILPRAGPQKDFVLQWCLRFIGMPFELKKVA